MGDRDVERKGENKVERFFLGHGPSDHFPIYAQFQYFGMINLF
jgi:hypothetical protein